MKPSSLPAPRFVLTLLTRYRKITPRCVRAFECRAMLAPVFHIEGPIELTSMGRYPTSSFVFRFPIVGHIFSSAQVTADPQSRLTNATERGLARIFPSHAPVRSHGPSMGSVGAPVVLNFHQDKGQSFGMPGASSDPPPLFSHPFPSQAANIIGSPPGWSSAFPWCEVTKQNHPSRMGGSEGCVLDDPFGTISCAGSRFQGET